MIRLRLGSELELRLRTQGSKGFQSREEIKRLFGFLRLPAPVLERDSEALAAPSSQNQTRVSQRHREDSEQPRVLPSLCTPGARWPSGGRAEALGGEAVVGWVEVVVILRFAGSVCNKGRSGPMKCLLLQHVR